MSDIIRFYTNGWQTHYHQYGYLDICVEHCGVPADLTNQDPDVIGELYRRYRCRKCKKEIATPTTTEHKKLLIIVKLKEL